MKILPANPGADTGCLQLDQTGHPAVAEWLMFLRRWGGGFIWPNAHHTPAEIAALHTGNPAFNLQYLLTPAEVLVEQAAGMKSGWWDSSTMPLGRVSNGDALLIVTSGDQGGQILYWAPAGDGLNYLRPPVATSFNALLSGLYDDPEMGLTPPWRNMSPVDFAAAQELAV